ncbi:hypothetical protein ACQRBK_04115 [Peptoniphilaceae bacterium SGI.137]|nr:hypothetical protein [Peptoniphilaceae bacterium]MCI6659793.1 hypothetical protein [Peptoniphilaceae bacterium]MDY3986386.1 hypothetical protein [Peptoniphilaceae bacterium]MDY4195912.1 hypothetical protein [Peptoniphilaceae bacterium]MDY5841439.1 hypothetical protein [Peptoniphilaceae bacterium]
MHGFIIPDKTTMQAFTSGIYHLHAAFSAAIYTADHIYDGSLPIPIHFLTDKFANETQL